MQAMNKEMTVQDNVNVDKDIPSCEQLVANLEKKLF
jgi:hypothetical protein